MFYAIVNGEEEYENMRCAVCSCENKYYKT